MTLRVILADDHQIVRSGLRALLEKQGDIEIVGEAQDGKEAVQLAKDLQPDLVAMDVSMPGLNGIDATRQIREEAPRVKVLALSMHSDRRFVVEMLAAGASGYLPKNCAFEELTRAIRTIGASGFYLSPALAVSKADATQPTGGSPGPRLTAREREVLQLIAEGHTTHSIADRLGISVKTVEAHRQHIMDKLQIHSIAELTKYAVREGLTALEP